MNEIYDEYINSKMSNDTAEDDNTITILWHLIEDNYFYEIYKLYDENIIYDVLSLVNVGIYRLDAYGVAYGIASSLSKIY